MGPNGSLQGALLSVEFVFGMVPDSGPQRYSNFLGDRSSLCKKVAVGGCEQLDDGEREASIGGEVIFNLEEFGPQLLLGLALSVFLQSVRI